MASNQQPGLRASTTSNHLPLALLRHGSGLIAFGMLFGAVIPLATYPRLALTAHIQFIVEGMMVLVAGLLLQSGPFTKVNPPSRETKEHRSSAMLADRLGKRQTALIYWGFVGIWVTLLSEAANAWWGTQWVLTIAHQAAGLQGPGPAQLWMEIVVAITHWPAAALLVLVVSN